jgi:hypothetical protein
MRHIVFGITLAAILLACKSGWNAPISNAPTKDNPCGIDGVVCAANGKVTGMCCNSGETCCNGDMCPAGMCEDIDEDQGLAMRKSHPQWKASLEK